MGVRPEGVRVSDKKGKGTVEFLVDAFETTGKDFDILHLVSENQELSVRSPKLIPMEESAYVTFPSENLHFFDWEGKRI